MNKIYIGIDPGLHGACGVISGDSFRAAFDLPIISDKTLRWVDAPALLQLIDQAHCGQEVAGVYIERVSAMPKQGVASSFQFGVGFGSLLGIMRGTSWPLALVTSPKWKGHYNLTRDKAASLDKARMMFPQAELTLKKHEARAEALLIAYYGMMQAIRGFVA